MGDVLPREPLPPEIDATKLEAAVKAGATGLTVLETPFLLGLRQQITALAAKLRLFAIYTNRDFVDAGGLLSYGTDRRQQFRRAAELVDKILKGETKKGQIPRYWDGKASERIIEILLREAAVANTAGVL